MAFGGPERTFLNQAPKSSTSKKRVPEDNECRATGKPVCCCDKTDVKKAGVDETPVDEVVVRTAEQEQTATAIRRKGSDLK